jgi:hypothetical protein
MGFFNLETLSTLLDPYFTPQAFKCAGLAALFLAISKHFFDFRVPFGLFIAIAIGFTFGFSNKRRSKIKEVDQAAEAAVDRVLEGQSSGS